MHAKILLNFENHARRLLSRTVRTYVYHNLSDHKANYIAFDFIKPSSFVPLGDLVRDYDE